jgi:hypothetical protein
MNVAKFGCWRRSRVEEFLQQLGRTAAGMGVEGGRVRVLATSHGGFIREMNLFLVRRYGCTMPGQVGCPAILLWYHLKRPFTFSDVGTKVSKRYTASAFGRFRELTF